MRALWKGYLSLGLVHLPVRLYAGSQERRLNFDFLRRSDLCPIGYRWVCKTTGEEVAYRDIVRGFEYQAGSYVVLSEEDFEQANLLRTRTIEVLNFTVPAEIDTKYYEKPYYLEPQAGGEKMYLLLREALKAADRVGIVRFTLRTLEYLGILKSDGDYLMVNQIRFQSELKINQLMKIPVTSNLSQEELELTLRLIDHLSRPFEPAEHEDIYAQELQQVIRWKVEGRKRLERGAEPEPTKESEIKKKLKESLKLA